MFHSLIVPPIPSEFGIGRTYHGMLQSVISLVWNMYQSIDGEYLAFYNVSISPSPVFEPDVISNASSPLNLTILNQRTYDISITTENCVGMSETVTLLNAQVRK